MNDKSNGSVIGYHYTNNEAYLSMQNGRTYGETGLIPIKRFINLSNGANLPNEAYDGVIEGLLEPEPGSWIENPEYPHIWNYLMHDICKRKEVLLISFDIQHSDLAFVVERAHMENEFYKKAKGQGEITRDSMNKAVRKYWESRVPVQDYQGGYSVPQLTLWSSIEFSRLNLVWRQPTDNVWRRVLDKGW